MHDFHPKRPQGIVHCIEDYRRWRDGAAFAHAFDAEGGVRRRRLHVIDPHGRDLGCSRQQVIREGRGERLAVAVIPALLVHRGPDALRHAAQSLAFNHHRIDQRSAVLGDDVVENLHVAELGIDRDHCGVRCIAERPAIHFWAKAHRRFEPAEVNIGRKPLRPQIPSFRHLAQRHRALGSDNGTILVTRRREGALHEMRPDRDETRQQSLARVCHSAAGHDDGAGRIGARGVGRKAGIAVHHANLGDINAHDLVRDLRERRFHSLPVRMHADTHFQTAVRRHAHRRLIVTGDDRKAPGGEYAGAVRGLLTVAGKTDPDSTAVRLAARLAFPPRRQIELLAHQCQGRLIVPAVVVLAGDIGVRHRRSRHEILVAHFPGIAADRAGDGIDHQLHGEADTGARYAPVRQEAGLVGGDAMRAAAIAAEIVRSRQIADGLPRFQRNRERPIGIGASVDGDLGVERLEPAARVGIGGEAIMMLARICAGHEVLPPVLDVAERVAVFQREPGNA